MIYLYVTLHICLISLLLFFVMFIWYFGCIYYIHFNKTTVYSHASISVRLYLEMLNANISTLTMPMF